MARGETLERDGEPARQVYREFAEYVGGLPLVSFNLAYDLDEVLKPEWKRLGIGAIGSRGFCALRLAQRLLDPVSAGNCKLQTLRQYYRLPERGAHTALSDLQTVADLMAQVLRPMAGHCGLDTWEKLVASAVEEWFPSRIAFGKHKGRLIQEARKDAELRGWLDWLAKSANARNAKMGRWYLRQLEMAAAQPDTTVFAAPGIDGETKHVPAAQVGHIALVIYLNPELEQLRQLVAAARARLAELEASFTKEKSRVDVMQAVLFRQLRSPGGISRSSYEHSRAFQREPNRTGRGEPLYSTGRALSAARPAAAHRGLPAEVSGFAGARRRGGSNLNAKTQRREDAKGKRLSEPLMAIVEWKQRLRFNLLPSGSSLRLCVFASLR
ncbi:MAG: hypothetical protein HYY24_21340 [Verrucomicrobia bacterium]|nr:hypothetical protein [Verrucomicrobiota bacterium]